MINLTVEVSGTMEKVGRVKAGDIIVVDRTPKSTLKSFVYMVTESKEYPKCDLKGLGTGQRLRNVRFEVNEFTAEELKEKIHETANIATYRIHVYDSKDININVYSDYVSNDDFDEDDEDDGFLEDPANY